RRGARDSAAASSYSGLWRDRTDCRRAAVKTLHARRLLIDDGVIEWPLISIDSDGRIAAIESGEANDEDTTITSAFFDVHVHGAAGHDVMEGTSEALSAIGSFLAARGVAHYLATT